MDNCLFLIKEKEEPFFEGLEISIIKCRDGDRF